ncbi:RNA polymerase sigma factor SigA [Aquisphaera giovannonii]|uniref:RNA polymerase sigma factor SigA n=1 Tax=Aquisphaera giovannonii TaxID=406548 RepID=A0A5B9WE33_9BACT|nr:sigma-70 family RNA polymerase sigma factor [Aquisphaera giovannonii]QEH38723.1 RNA polymerase sigma factor SigA [Aquisphaera giovannonii]
MNGDAATWTPGEAGRLSPAEVRALLRELAECRRALDGRPAGQDAARLRDGYVAARDRIALGSSWVVWSVARRYRGVGIPLRDLMQEGFCGLLEAIDRFDPAMGNDLSTYAVWWIRQRIQCLVAASAYPVKVHPRGLRKVAEFWRRGPHRDEGRPAGPIPATLRRLLAATQSPVPLDMAGAGRSPRSAILAGPPDAGALDLEDRESLEAMLGSLKPRERTVLHLRFGLGGEEEHTLDEAGRRLGLGKERIRQIQNEALEKLRAWRAGTPPRPAPRGPLRCP